MNPESSSSHTQFVSVGDLKRHCFCYNRSECSLLPVPGFHHLPQLAASEAPHVLVGLKPASCQKRSRRHGGFVCLFVFTCTNSLYSCSELGFFLLLCFRSTLWTVMSSPGRESWAILTSLHSVIFGAGVWRPCSSEVMDCAGPSVLPGSSLRYRDTPAHQCLRSVFLPRCLTQALVHLMTLNSGILPLFPPNLDV